MQYVCVYYTPRGQTGSITLLQEGVTAVQQVQQWQFDIMETLQGLETPVPPETPQERSE